MVLEGFGKQQLWGERRLAGAGSVRAGKGGLGSLITSVSPGRAIRAAHVLESPLHVDTVTEGEEGPSPVCPGGSADGAEPDARAGDAMVPASAVSCYFSCVSCLQGSVSLFSVRESRRTRKEAQPPPPWRLQGTARFPPLPEGVSARLAPTPAPAVRAHTVGMSGRFFSIARFPLGCPCGEDW